MNRHTRNLLEYHRMVVIGGPNMLWYKLRYKRHWKNKFNAASKRYRKRLEKLRRRILTKEKR